MWQHRILELFYTTLYEQPPRLHWLQAKCSQYNSLQILISADASLAISALNHEDFTQKEGTLTGKSRFQVHWDVDVDVWLHFSWWADLCLILSVWFREVWGQLGHSSSLQLLHQFISVCTRIWSRLCQTQSETRYVFTMRSIMGFLPFLKLLIDILMIRHRSKVLEPSHVPTFYRKFKQFTQVNKHNDTQISCKCLVNIWQIIK